MTTSVALSPVAILQFFDNTGKPCIGGTLLTQSGGVNYATYSEPTGTTALPNPIPLNSRGEVSTAAGSSSELFLQTGVNYTFTLKDSAGNQLWSVGNVTSAGGGNLAVSFPTASGSANAQIITNAVPISLGLGTIQWFLPVAGNTSATTINVDNSGAKNAFFLTKALVGGELQPGVPAQIIYDGTQWNLVVSAKGPAADYYVDSGTVNALVIIANMSQSPQSNGSVWKIKVANTTTSSAPTLTVNGIGGAQSILLSDGVTPAPAGSMIANNIYQFMYEFINSSSAIILLNPSRVTGGFTATLATGLTTTPSGTLNYAILPDGRTAQIWCNSAITGTSNTTAMGVSGFPAIIQSTNTHSTSVSILTDSGVNTAGSFRGTNTGTWTAQASGSQSSAGFTNTGVKGIPAGFWTTLSLD